MDKTEVTNSQFVVFLNEAYEKNQINIRAGIVYSSNDKVLFKTQESEPFSQITFAGNKFSLMDGKNNFPVVFVSWLGAKEYADFYGWKLPSEAQWEYAASWDSANNKKYVYGVSADEIKKTDANYMGSGDDYENIETIPATTPVGFYTTQSPSGLHDMSGNVWEWCSDYYVYKPYNKKPEKCIWNNPVQLEKSSMKVIRGGGWDTEFSTLRSTIRLGIHPEATLINLGFRCVEE